MDDAAIDRLLDRLRKGTGQGFLVSEIALVVGCSRSFVYKLIRSKALTARKLGGDYRIPPDEARRVAEDLGVSLAG